MDARTVAALRRLKDTGRKLILVTGRELDELKRLFPEIGLFDRVVAENGAVLHTPATGAVRVIASPPPPEFVRRLLERGVEPLSAGKAIVATWRPHETAVLETIAEFGLELQIIFNKGAVMVLPAGVNKASGMAAALADLHLSAANVVAVGDAENDHAFLRASGCSAAVANALTAIREEADIKLQNDHGAGVVELIERLMREDERLAPLHRRGMPIGFDRNQACVFIEPHQTVLVLGGSASGKSSLAKALTERMAERRLEFCVLDAEGDYEDLEDAAVVGRASTPPQASDLVDMLRRTGINFVVNVVALGGTDRARVLSDLLPLVEELRGQFGRPHWLVVDEAHQFLPRGGSERHLTSLTHRAGLVLITLAPEMLARDALDRIDLVISIGDSAASLMKAFAQETDRVPPVVPGLHAGEALVWKLSEPAAQPFRMTPPRQAHHRHRGKYAAGTVPDWKGFRFIRDGHVLSVALNLSDFIRIAGQLDDGDWQRHLRAGDYVNWFRYVIRDDGLADATAAVQAQVNLTPQASRGAVVSAIRERYTICS